MRVGFIILIVLVVSVGIYLFIQDNKKYGVWKSSNVCYDLDGNIVSCSV